MMIQKLASQLEEKKKKLEEISQYISENEISREETITVPETKEISDNEKVEEDSNLNDSELFDLIDSMYEKEDDE